MKQSRFSDASQKLINTLIEEGRLEVFDLTKKFLEIIQDPENEDITATDKNLKPLPKPQANLEDWQYVQFFKQNFQKLLDLDSGRAFELASGLLLDYLRLAYPNSETNEKYYDISTVWRPAIEDHQQNHKYYNIEDSLVSAVRDAAIYIIKSNPMILRELVLKLENHKWLIFRRIALYLLSEHPTLEPTMVLERLNDEELFNNTSFRHEYALLGKKGFGVITLEEQELILQRIEKASELSMAIEKDKAGGAMSEAQGLKIIECWKRDRLSHFNEYLKGGWKNRYEDLVSKHGEPDHPDFSCYSTSFSGPVSTVSAQALIEMGKEKMFALLKTWEPKNDPSGFGASKEGLGRELSAAVKLNPEHFVPFAEDFKGVDPTYVRSFLDGLYGLIQNNNASLGWRDILTLCQWIVQQPLQVPERKGGAFDQDPDWSWTRRSIGSLLCRGLSDGSIIFEYREVVWSIIEPLTEDPHPTPEEELTREGFTADDAYNLSINTVRGEAMNATIEYALWVYRNLEKMEGGKDKLKAGFALMPEVQNTLEKHLVPTFDPSMAIRAVYGRFFPWLLLVDREWTLANVNAIFPLGQFDSPLYRAAWRTYITHVSPYDEPLIVLKERYKEAVQGLVAAEASRSSNDTNEHEVLTQHLMIYYSRGKLALDDELFINFWNKANSELRQHAMENIGRYLESDKSILPDEIQIRLKELWDKRLHLAQQASDKSLHEGEMSAFGLWFASGKFEERWSCEQYLKALEIGGLLVSYDYFVLKRLVETVRVLPVETIKILEKLIGSGRNTWTVFGNKEELRSIILTALQSPEEQAQKAANDFTNRLVARGHVEFRDLLVRDSTP